jgi:hypothetical protein
VNTCDAASGFWIMAGLWGLLGGGALLLGAAMGYLAAIPRRVVTSVMDHGAGVLVSALSFDLLLERETVTRRTLHEERATESTSPSRISRSGACSAR